MDDARAASQSHALTTRGRPEDAPTTHRLAVYRIAQEALTNARKHAEGAPVTMTIDYRAPTTLVEVTNPAGLPGPAADVGSGFGLVGLRERVSALGGRLTVGPAGGGSWRLAARIPHPAGRKRTGLPPDDAPVRLGPADLTSSAPTRRLSSEPVRRRPAHRVAVAPVDARYANRAHFPAFEG